MGPASLPNEAGDRPDPPRLETFDYGEINAAGKAHGVQLRNETLIGVGLLVGLGALLLGGVLLEPDRALIRPAIPFVVLLLSLALLLFLIEVVTAYPVLHRQHPRILTIGAAGFAIAFDGGRYFGVRWTDPAVLIRIVSSGLGRHPDPPFTEPVIHISRAAEPERESLLLERLPPGAMERMIAMARSRGLGVYRERFRVSSKITVILDEIQLRAGPPIDTELRSIWVRRVRMPPGAS